MVDETLAQPIENFGTSGEPPQIDPDAVTAPRRSRRADWRWRDLSRRVPFVRLRSSPAWQRTHFGLARWVPLRHMHSLDDDGPGRQQAGQRQSGWAGSLRRTEAPRLNGAGAEELGPADRRL